MNKIKSSLLVFSALLGSLVLSSCMGDGTNKMSRSAIFTVEKSGSSYTLYADYGGVVRPSNVLELTDGKGFNNGDRVLLVYSYTDDNIKTETGKGSYIDNAELISGQPIPINNILTREKAEASKLLEKDSIFSFANNVTSLQLSVYRGYLTASFTGRYSIVSGKGVYPSLNLVYDPAENERPNTLKLTAVYNRHTAADAQAGSQSFFISYPLTAFTGINGSEPVDIDGKDPIEIIVDGLGFTEPLKSKVERVDMTPGNYLYFQ